jgi:hypothetical protein
MKLFKFRLRQRRGSARGGTGRRRTGWCGRATWRREGGGDAPGGYVMIEGGRRCAGSSEGRIAAGRNRALVSKSAEPHWPQAPAGLATGRPRVPTQRNRGQLAAIGGQLDTAQLVGNGAPPTGKAGHSQA